MKNKNSIVLNGNKITISHSLLQVPNDPIIPYIEGDGIGKDIVPIMIKVVNESVKKAYNGRKKIFWIETYCGSKSEDKYGKGFYLTDEVLDIIKNYLVSIKGPLTTPIGQGIRSLNFLLRKILNLYYCVRPIRYFFGAPSPVKNPELIDMVIFRENLEDTYCGAEWKENTLESKKIIKFLREEMKVDIFQSNNNYGIGIKICSKNRTEQLINAAIQYAIKYNRKKITIVHKGNIMKYTEGSFRNWSFDFIKNKFNGKEIEDGFKVEIKNSRGKIRTILINERITDSFFQQILLRPNEYDIVVSMNLNGDYISDALAAQIGGIGIAPSANFGDLYALFEPVHGSAPKYAGKDKVNPSSMILSGEMMLRYIGWDKAADLIIKGLKNMIHRKLVTYDFYRFLPESKLLRSSEFGNYLIDLM